MAMLVITRPGTFDTPPTIRSELPAAPGCCQRPRTPVDVEVEVDPSGGAMEQWAQRKNGVV